VVGALAIAALWIIVIDARKEFETQKKITLLCEHLAILDADKSYPTRTPISAWRWKEGRHAHACMLSRGYEFNADRPVCQQLGFAERFVAPFCYVPSRWHGWWLYVLANSNGMD
jgi:hypothetical protein